MPRAADRGGLLDRGLRLLAPLLVLSAASCAPPPVEPEDPFPYRSPGPAGRVVARRPTSFDRAISELQPQIDYLDAQYPPTYSFKHALEVQVIRAWYGLRLQELMNPYHDRFVRMVGRERILAKPVFEELERYVESRLNVIQKRLDKEYLRFKPWQRPRYEKLRD